MMHRVKKKNDVNKDKWIGIGGHFEDTESPYDCIIREAKEETGLSLIAPEYRGLITFASPGYETEQMHLFLCSSFSGELRTDCEEGDLAWITKDTLYALPMWEGDKLFLDLLHQKVPFFSLKLIYDAQGILRFHELHFTGNTRPPMLISACLLGSACRYDGKTKPLPDEDIRRLSENYILIPVCGEVMGGLPVPRIPAEVQTDGSVRRRDGVDVTAAYRQGANEILRIARLTGASIALLKARSPSCGKGNLYDGTFSGTLNRGNGITAQTLLENGIRVYTEEELASL